MPFTPPTTVASKATTGYLAQFFLGTAGSPTTYQAVAEVKQIQVSYASAPEVNATHLLSPNSTEEVRAGLIKPGTFELTCNFIGDASQLAILTAIQNAAANNPPNQPLKIVAPVNDGTQTYTATFQGYLNKYEVGPFENNKVTEVKIGGQITGSIVEAVA